MHSSQPFIKGMVKTLHNGAWSVLFSCQGLQNIVLNDKYEKMIYIPNMQIIFGTYWICQVLLILLVRVLDNIN